LAYAENVARAVGNTPLIKLKRASEETGCTILGKAEFANPAQSVKDRAALFLIEDALARGAVKAGGVVVEGTAGNTGIGLAALGRAYGLRTVIVMPDTQSIEKKDAVRALGAELVEVPAVAYANPNNYVHYSRRLAEALAATEPNGAVWANQFDNVANRDGHARWTAEEIWDQTQGRIDGFVSAVGTGGTLAGVALGLRARSKDVKIALADPPGAALYAYYTKGVLEAHGSSITEGIGQGRITKNLEGFVPDVSFEIPDTDSVPLVHRLVVEEGLCVGGSSGVNIAGAVRLARELGPGHVIVTMLCDHGSRYQSKLANPEFLRSKGLPVPDWLAGKAGSLPSMFA
jgi:cysteine synthase A